MPKYRLSLTHISPYKDRIVDSVHIQESTGQRKLTFSHTSRSDYQYFQLILAGKRQQVTYKLVIEITVLKIKFEVL